MLVPHRSDRVLYSVNSATVKLHKLLSRFAFTEIEIEITRVMKMNYRGTAGSNSTCIRQTLNSAVADKPCNMFVRMKWSG